jgi:hypothetical protein
MLDHLLGAHSAIKFPAELANTSSQNASKAGSYAGEHRVYAPGVLTTLLPIPLAITLVYETTNFPVVLGVTLV